MLKKGKPIKTKKNAIDTKTEKPVTSSVKTEK